jgi:hypothetical protein
VYQGHTTDCGVIVPFDPSKTWKESKPLPIGYRKLVGHAVQGTIEGAPFESWIFHYFRQWRMVVPGPALDAANVAAGHQATFTVRPHPRPDEAPPFTPGPKLRGAGSPRTRSRKARPKR